MRVLLTRMLTQLRQIWLNGIFLILFYASFSPILLELNKRVKCVIELNFRFQHTNHFKQTIYCKLEFIVK